VPIRDAEVSISRSSPDRVHKIITDDEVSMSWSKHGCGRVPRSLSTRRWSGKAHRLVAIAILSLLPALAISALGFPPAPPESGGEPVPGITSEKPLESGVPPIPPSRIDPGIQHVPEKRGDPRAVVKPPNLDPGISTNPDVAPPAPKGINPPGGGTPQEKPDVR
jgi:hypothetical protein